MKFWIDFLIYSSQKQSNKQHQQRYGADFHNNQANWPYSGYRPRYRDKRQFDKIQNAYQLYIENSYLGSRLVGTVLLLNAFIIYVMMILVSSGYNDKTLKEYQAQAAERRVLHDPNDLLGFGVLVYRSWSRKAQSIPPL